MSDIFLSFGVTIDVGVVEAHLRWTKNTQVFSGQSAGLNWVVTRVDSANLWSPAWDAASRTRVLLAGRFAFEEAEWLQAERLPYEGGLAARLILDRWLKNGARAIEQLNGAGMAVIVDDAARDVHIWTDRMGFYPIFAWTGVGFIVCSHPDVAAEVLAKAGRPCKFDAITMAEFLRTGTATQPHTYWDGIDQLNAGTRYRFTWTGEPCLKASSQYWRPAYFDQPYLEDREEIVERLTDALKSAVHKRTLPRLGKVALLLSAGADSRAALFSACEPSKVTCFTFYDEPNQELRGAQALAAAAGATHVGYQRSKDYYFEHAEQSIRVSGGMWTLESAHHTGLLSQLGSSDFGTVLTGCYADYLLKGIVYNRAPRKLLGREIPLHTFAPFTYQWHHPHFCLSSTWNERVVKRLDTRLHAARTAGVDARSETEYLRLAPIIREPDASGRLTLRRCTALDIFMSDSAVLDLFGQICPEEKLNGVPFGMAVSRIIGESGRVIPNSNYSAPVGANELQRIASFVRASFARKLRRQDMRQPYENNPSSVATTSSWPHYSRVIQLSQRVQVWHSSQPTANREFLNDILGAARRDWSIQDWANQAPTLFMRYYTASVWLGLHPEALGRIAISRFAD